MAIPSGVDVKRSKVYIQQASGEYLQIHPETFCEQEIVADSMWPVSSHALKLRFNELDTITAPFAGATTTSPGAGGTVPPAEIGDRNSFLRGDGQWTQIKTTDDKVKFVGDKNRRFYIAGTAIADTNIGQATFDASVYVSEVEGQLHANKFVGKLQGDVKGNLDGQAERAKADANGNIISSYYAKKSDLVALAQGEHTHSASDVVSLNGYTKASSYTAISTNDTLNNALGKLEKRFDSVAEASSPTLSGTPTAPTPTSNSVSNQIANKEYVDNKISELIGGAGDAFDTLNELKQALGSDPNFANSMTTQLGTKLDKTSSLYTKSLSISDNTSGTGQILKIQRGDNTTYTLTIKDTVVQPATAEPKASSLSPKVGTSVRYAREDHVHPLQETIAGNAATATSAGTADKLATARKLRTNLAATEDATFDGSTNQLNIPVAGILPVANGGTGASNLNAFVQTSGNQTIAGTKTFSSTIDGSINGNAATATTATKVQGASSGTTWVTGAQAGKSIVTSTATGYGTIFNAPTKNYRVALGTFPSSDNLVYLYSVTNENVNAGTNTKAKQLTWNADTGELSATSFKGTLSGSATSCTGNAATATKATQDSDGNAINTTYLKKSGGTITGTLDLTRATDAQGTGTNAPALRIGSLTGAHLEFDGNEIMAKASENTVGPLYINNDGGQVIIGSGGLKTTGAIIGNLTGNVTGNVSGSSGSCTGNAATATALKTARYIDGVSFNGSADIAHYASCSTAAGTPAKTATITGFALKTGAKATIKFTNENTAANPTLNINSTGDKSIASVPSNGIEKNKTYDFVFNGSSYEIVSSTDSIPVGSIIWSARKSAPGGYLICDGSAVSRTTYADLYSAIGTTYGSGDGSTTFNLPNLIDRFPQGSQTANVGTTLAAGLPNISGGHLALLDPGGLESYSGGPWTVTSSYIEGAGYGGGSSYDCSIYFDASKANALYGQSNTVQPPALKLLPCIKAFGGISNSGSLDASKLASDLATLSSDLRNMHHYSLSEPTDTSGANGDIWFQYTDSNDSASTFHVTHHYSTGAPVASVGANGDIWFQYI